MYSAKSAIIPSWRDRILGVAKLAKVGLSHIANNAEAAFADIFPYQKHWLLSSSICKTAKLSYRKQNNIHDGTTER
jgi:hypothetical protein